jgi:integrase/recombinase XerD
MRRKAKITMIATESAAETYERFLLTKRANGVKTKTIDTYMQHFHAISKHLDISQEVAEMTATDLKEMVVSMQESGVAHAQSCYVSLHMGRR